MPGWVFRPLPPPRTAVSKAGPATLFPAGVTPTQETNQSEVGFEATATAVKVGVARSVGSAGFSATCTAIKIGVGRGQAEAGLRASTQALKVALGTAQAEVGYEAVSQAVHLAAAQATAQASMGLEATGTATKRGLVQAVASAGVQAQCSSGLKIGVGTARASAGWRVTVIDVQPGAPSVAPKLIWVDGRFALRLSSVIYERV